MWGQQGESDEDRAAGRDALAASLVAHLDALSGSGAAATRALAAHLFGVLLARKP